MKSWSICTLVVASIAIGLISIKCGKKDGSSVSDATNATITGMASAGPIEGGTVTAYKLNADGSEGETLATATTDANGTYTLSFPAQTDPVGITVAGGKYVEEATGTTVELGTEKLRVYFDSLSAGAKEVGVTPLTEMAVQRAQEQLATYQATATSLAEAMKDAIKDANYAVADAAGLTDVTIMPANPYKSMDNTSEEMKKYALFLAGMSQAAKDSGVSGANSLHIMESYINDFKKDGKFDGKNDGTAVYMPGTTTAMPQWSDMGTKMTDYITYVDNLGTNTAGFTATYAPTINPIPQTTMPTPTISPLPGETGNTTTVSCSVTTVEKGSCRTAAGSFVKCTDYVKSSAMDSNMVQSMCTMQGGTYSSSPCVTTTKVGGCRMGSGTEYDMIEWFISGYSANQVTSYCSTMSKCQ